MELGILDGLAFFLFIAVVVLVSLYASRGQEDSEDYFLAGRTLTWTLIGFSLIASNISTEHFVGMAGKGYEMGLAIASYEWIAAATLVLVAVFLLPLFLRSGIYTIPEFLEYRFNAASRAIMAAYMLFAYVAVAISSVLYSGALALKSIFGLNLWAGVWMIGLIAGAYTIYGGLKAVVWTDLIQGAALLLGGALVTLLGFHALGGNLGFLAGVDRFFELGKDKLHTILPAKHPEMPWTILLAGIWIPNIFYWGLNQFICQRTLGAKSLAEGQKGIILAAWLKLLIPFIIVFPGIMALELYADKIPKGDQAYPIMIKYILPRGLRGVMFAALFGAVMSSLDSMLNSASTIFTMDLFKRHLRPEADAATLLKVGRWATAACVLVGCLWAPFLDRFPAIFTYIQKVWGFISPGIVAVFIFGLVVKKAPPLSAVAALLLTAPVYGLLLYFTNLAFLNAMVVTVLVLWAVMAAITIISPLPEPVTFPVNQEFDMTRARGLYFFAALTIAATAALYIIFR